MPPVPEKPTRFHRRTLQFYPGFPDIDSPLHGPGIALLKSGGKSRKAGGKSADVQNQYCTICGTKGHKRTKCPNKVSHCRVSSEQRDDDDNVTVVKNDLETDALGETFEANGRSDGVVRVRYCSFCGNQGHNRTTCRARSDLDRTPVQPPLCRFCRRGLAKPSINGRAGVQPRSDLLAIVRAEETDHVETGTASEEDASHPVIELSSEATMQLVDSAPRDSVETFDVGCSASELPPEGMRYVKLEAVDTHVELLQEVLAKQEHVKKKEETRLGDTGETLEDASHPASEPSVDRTMQLGVKLEEVNTHDDLFQKVFDEQENRSKEVTEPEDTRKTPEDALYSMGELSSETTQLMESREMDPDVRYLPSVVEELVAVQTFDCPTCQNIVRLLAHKQFHGLKYTCRVRGKEFRD